MPSASAVSVLVIDCTTIGVARADHHAADVDGNRLGAAGEMLLPFDAAHRAATLLDVRLLDARPAGHGQTPVRCSLPVSKREIHTSSAISATKPVR